MMTETPIEWKPLTEAAREVGISPAKLSGLVKRGLVETEKDRRDERLTLVNMTQLREMFPPRR